ncbi:MAG: toll/interleukin-1 receptor domain-containing protein, partial [Pirellulales bacterium]|nr:toll/interleukin-1 receptor domain-containing protein [Pirellulales bacterium]
MLFSEASLQTLGFVKASQIDAALFIKLIEQASPKYIFDLRSAPNFGRGGLTRRSAFALFDEYNSRYFDVAGAVGAKGADDAILNPNILVPALQKKLLQSTKPLAGPVLFFVEEEQFVERYFDLIAANLPSLDDRGWEIAVWPSNSSADVSVQERRLVFISHANPQDNEIALWLSSRLTAEGYEVWSDITRLTGGELFWDTIEDVIRNQAAKVLVLLSKDSQNKPGVLDEVNVAIATERSRGLQRFVIPIRIDDLPFSEIRANLARKNVIDGQNNLANALNQVLEELQQSNVNKIVNIPIISMLRWQSENSKNEIQTREDWDLLIENRIRIEKWPKSIKKFKIPNSDAAQDYRAIPFPFPAHPCADGFLTFASWEEIKREKKQIVRGGEVVTNTFLETSGSDFLIGREADANRALVSLVRQGWDALCSNTGLKRFDLAGTFHCWFFENGFERGNTVRFVDHLGASRRKSLVGKSETRGVYWHFGIEARPSVRDGSIRLKAHVIFSEDGKTPISSPARQHILRRGFCRNWWNDRWRDLLAAALQHLSGGRESIRLPVSANDPLTVSASMVVYRAKRTSGDFKESGRNGHRLLFVEEPKLAVGYKQFTDDPREGLLLFGPVSFKRNPSNIRIGVIGTSEGLELFQNWCANFNKPIKEDTSSGRTVPFPGFQAAFGARWPNHPTYSRPISKTDLINAIRLKDRHQAVFKTVGLFTEEIRKAVKDNDVDVDIWFVVIPDEIYLYGRPASRVPSAISIATPNALGRKVAKRFRRETPSLFPEDNVEAKIYDHHVDFHNQLKARLLELGAITQILRESSIVGANAPATSFTDSSDDQSANTAAEGSNQTA